MFGQNGFPAISVPAGSRRQVYDRVPDPRRPIDGTRLVGPVAARLPVGVDFAARPFGEPTLVSIAAAYEKATKHREGPAEFKSGARTPNARGRKISTLRRSTRAQEYGRCELSMAS